MLSLAIFSRRFTNNRGETLIRAERVRTEPSTSPVSLLVRCDGSIFHGDGGVPLCSQGSFEGSFRRGRGLSAAQAAPSAREVPCRPQQEPRALLCAPESLALAPYNFHSTPLRLQRRPDVCACTGPRARVWPASSSVMLYLPLTYTPFYSGGGNSGCVSKQISLSLPLFGEEREDLLFTSNVLMSSPALRSTSGQKGWLVVVGHV